MLDTIGISSIICDELFLNLQCSCACVALFPSSLLSLFFLVCAACEDGAIHLWLLSVCCWRLHVMSIMGNSWCFVLELEVPALHFLILSLHSCTWYAPAPDKLCLACYRVEYCVSQFLACHFCCIHGLLFSVAGCHVHFIFCIWSSYLIPYLHLPFLHIYIYIYIYIYMCTRVNMYILLYISVYYPTLPYGILSNPRSKHCNQCRWVVGSARARALL